MTELFRGTVPLPPSINGSYKIVRCGYGAMRLAGTPALSQFKQDARLMLAQSRRPPADELARIRRQKLALSVELTFYIKSLWQRDVDGGIKAALDAAFGYLGLNDNLVTELYCSKLKSNGAPCCEIVIRISD